MRLLKSGAHQLACGLAIITASQAIAQRPGKDPHVAYVFPAGCQQGTSCEVVVGGQYLKEVSEMHLAGDGVKVEFVGWYRPMTRGEFNNLRMATVQAKEALIAQHAAQGIRRRPSEDEILDAAEITEQQRREMRVYRQRNADPRRQPNDQLEEELTLRLTVDADAPLGKRELRLMTDTSMSNPIWLHVGRWPEVQETEPNDQQPDSPIQTFPTVINGQIMPGDVDAFSFEAKKGMDLVIEAAARDVIPYLADAVPGWFQAVMTLSDSDGNELQFADSFHYRQDPVLHFEVPRDDTYTLRIHDSLYRGREDFVYRLTIGEIPFVTSVFPLGAQVDTEVTVQLSGWNLTQNYLDVKTMSRRKHRPLVWNSVPQADGVSVRFPLQVDLLPEQLDIEPNNTMQQAQPISSRMTVNGRIDYPGDEDVFHIKGSGRLVVEVDARRRGSPLDSTLILTDADGNTIAFNDDYEDKSQGLLTHHADSHLTAMLSGSGGHYLRIVDAQNQGGNDFAYRLHVRAPQPDYELRVIPSTIVAWPGQVVPITVFALRKDGFDDDINLTLIEPAKGFTLHGGLIPSGQEQVQMTLKVPTTPSTDPFVLEMEGSSFNRRYRNRTPIVRPAVPAEQMMQAFIWYHLVPVEDWNVIVSGRPRGKMSLGVATGSRTVELPLDGKTVLGVTGLPKFIKPEEIEIELVDPPAGVSASKVASNAGEMAIEVVVDGDRLKVGDRNNLLVRVTRQWTPQPTSKDAKPKAKRVELGLMPAIPYQVVRSRR